MNTRHIPSATRERIKHLLRSGETVTNIHKRFADVSLSTIKRYRKAVVAEQETNRCEVQDK